VSIASLGRAHFAKFQNEVGGEDSPPPLLTMSTSYGSTRADREVLCDAESQAAPGRYF
jgi:hypothetical protein